jgi:hypothetical protein
MSDRQVDCAGCGIKLTITEPAPDGWDAVTAPDHTAPGRQLKVVSYRIVVRCFGCGARTVLQREDNPQS